MWGTAVWKFSLTDQLAASVGHQPDRFEVQQIAVRLPSNGIQQRLRR